MKRTIKTFYQNNSDYLKDLLQYMNQFFEFEIFKFRKSRKKNNKQTMYSSFYISDEEINNIFYNKKEKKIEDDNAGQSWAETIQSLESNIDEKLMTTKEMGINLPVIRLARIFDLNYLELKVLTFCFVAEVDKKYQNIFAYLQDSVDTPLPTIDFMLNLFTCNIDERIKGIEYFDHFSPLFYYDLIVFTDQNSGTDTPLISRKIMLNPHIASFLMENYSIDHELSSFAEITKEGKDLNSLDIRETTKSKLTSVSNYIHNDRATIQKSFVLLFTGPDENLKKEGAMAFSKSLNIPLLTINCETLFTDEANPDKLIKTLYREIMLFSCSVYFYNLGAFPAEHSIPQNKTLLKIVKMINNHPMIIFFSSEEKVNINKYMSNTLVTEIHFPCPEYKERIEYWKNITGQYNYKLDEELFDALASRFRFSRQEIYQAAGMAFSSLHLSNPNSPLDVPKTFFEACRDQSSNKLTELAVKINPCYRFNNIVLPDKPLNQLMELVDYVKYKEKVYSEWGFSRKQTMGKGLNALFHGYSGTGKTMAADIISNELEMDLYKIDLSTVISKYIGETEKNLSQIFKEAETSNAILFFDEADAIFGKRSEVRDAHDRYANIEVGYLLQKLDEYTGVIMLATNLRKNMDSAFIRRMHFSIEFPFPDEKQRNRIWKNIFPEETPLDKSIDFDFLSQNLKITGGNIRNIALSAAFLAAGKEHKITMENVIKASKREFDKMGKLCVKSDFGEYYSLIAENPVNKV